jgi:HSP20 family protein
MNMSRPPFPFHGIFASLRDEHGEAAFGGVQARPDTAKPAFNQTAGQAASAQGMNGPGPKATGQVAVDIYEQDGYYIIKAPIAGVRLSDLDIEISDNVLTIRGNRQQGDQVPGEHYYLQECFWGEFSRSVTLPFSIDPKKVKATFNKECILKILVPKEEKVKIVRINEA